MSQQQLSQPRQSQQLQTTTDQQFPGGTSQQTTQMQGGAQLQSQLYSTQNYLPESVRVEVIRGLNQTLADSTILMTQAKFAHWNLKGRDFFGLHALFDEVAEMFEDHVDDVAERITALGGQALGTAGAAVANRQVPSIPYDAVTGLEYVEILASQLAIHDAQLHQAIEVANGYDDVDTVDLLNEISREVSKQLWFLEAHLQTQPTSTISVSGVTGGRQAGTGGGQTAQQSQMGQQPQIGQQSQQFQQPQSQQFQQPTRQAQQPPSQQFQQPQSQAQQPQSQAQQPQSQQSPMTQQPPGQ